MEFVAFDSYYFFGAAGVPLGFGPPFFFGALGSVFVSFFLAAASYGFLLASFLIAVELVFLAC